MHISTSRKGTEPSLTFGLGRIYQSSPNAVYLQSLGFVGEYVFFDIGLYDVEQALPAFIPALFLSCYRLRYYSIVMDNKRHECTFVFFFRCLDLYALSLQLAPHKLPCNLQVQIRYSARSSPVSCAV